MIRENSATVLNATPVDENDLRQCELVALALPIDVLAAVEPQDDDRRGSVNLADVDATQNSCVEWST